MIGFDSAYTVCIIIVRQYISMSLLIQEVSVIDAPMELLLLADPSEDKIRSYLSGSKCFVASSGAVVVGACVVQSRGTDTYELMSIAVHPAHQKSGYGTALLKWVIDFFRNNYPEPIFEDGIQLFDMLRLTLRYSSNVA